MDSSECNFCDVRVSGTRSKPHISEGEIRQLIQILVFLAKSGQIEPERAGPIWPKKQGLSRELYPFKTVIKPSPEGRKKPFFGG